MSKNHAPAPRLCPSCRTRLLEMIAREPMAELRLEYCAHEHAVAVIHIRNGRIVHWMIDGPVDIAEVQRRHEELVNAGGVAISPVVPIKNKH